MNVMQMDPTHAGSSMLSMGSKVTNYQQQPDNVPCSTGEADGSFTQAPSENGALQDGADSSLMGSLPFRNDISDFGEQMTEPSANPVGYRQQNYYGPGFAQVGSRPLYANKSPKPSAMQSGFGTPRYPVPGVHPGSPTPTLNQLLTQGQQKYALQEFPEYGSGAKPPSMGQFENPTMWPPQRMDMYSQSGVQLSNQVPNNYDMRRGTPAMPPSYGPLPGQYGGNGMQQFSSPLVQRQMQSQGHGYMPQDMLGDPPMQDLGMDDRMVIDGRGIHPNMPGHIPHNQVSPGMAQHGLRPVQSMSPMVSGPCGQMMPPPASMNMYGKGPPVGMNGPAQHVPGLPVPMLSYGQQPAPGFHMSPQQQQQPQMPGYGQYPFDQMVPGSNPMFGQMGMHPRAGMVMPEGMPRKIFPSGSNGIAGDSRKVPPKQKRRKENSKTAAPVAAPSPSLSESSSCSGLDRPGGRGGEGVPAGGMPAVGATEGCVDSAAGMLSSAWTSNVGTASNSAMSVQLQGMTPGGQQMSSANSECIVKLYNMGQEPERRPFLDRLIAHMDERGTPISAMPQMSKQPLDLYRFYLTVKERGGFEQVSKRKLWKEVGNCIHIGASTYAAFTLKKAYLTYLLTYECRYDRNGRDPQAIISAMEAKNANAKKNSLRKKMAAAAAAAATGSSLGAPSPSDTIGHQQDSSAGGHPSFRPSCTTVDNTFSPAPSGSRDDSSSTPSSHGSEAVGNHQNQSRISGGAAMPSNCEASAMSGMSTPLNIGDGEAAAGTPSSDAGKPAVLAASAGSAYALGNNGPSLSGDAPSAGVAQGAGALHGAGVLAGAASSGSQAGSHKEQAAVQPHGGAAAQGSAVPEALAVNGYSVQDSWQQQQHNFFDSNSLDETLSSLGAFGQPAVSQQSDYGPSQVPQQRSGADAALHLSMMQPAQSLGGFMSHQQRPSGSAPAASGPMRAPSQQALYPAGSQVHAGGMMANYQRDSFASGAARSPRPSLSGGLSVAGNAMPGQGAFLPTASPDGTAPGGRYQNVPAAQYTHWGYGGTPNGMPGFAIPQQPPRLSSGPGPTAANCDGWGSSMEQPCYPSLPNFGGAAAQPYEYAPVPSSTGMMGIHGAMPNTHPTSDMVAQQHWLQQQQQLHFGAMESAAAASLSSNSQQIPMPPGYPVPQAHPVGVPPRPSSSAAAAPTQPHELSTAADHKAPGVTGSSAKSHTRSGSKSKILPADAGAGTATQDVTLQTEQRLPPDCVEAVQPKIGRRRKVLTSKDVGQVDASRILLSLKSGLLAESSWALDALSILLHDDAAVAYFSLARLPGLLDAVLQHYAHALNHIFPEFGDIINRSPSSAVDEETIIDKSALRGSTDGDPTCDLKPPSDQRMPQPLGPDYTWKTRTGLSVRIDSKCADSDCKQPLSELLSQQVVGTQAVEHASKQPQCDSGGAAASLCVASEVDSLAHHIVAGARAGSSPTLLRVKKLFYGSLCPVSQSKAAEPCALPEAANEAVHSSTSGECTVIEERTSALTRPPPAGRLTCNDLSSSRVVTSAADAACHVDGVATTDGTHPETHRQGQPNQTSLAVGVSAGGGKRRCCSSSFEDDEEPYVRDEPVLSVVDDDREAMAARVLCAANIIRSLSFVPGNEKQMCSSSQLLSVLGGLLRVHCRVAVAEPSWWWPYLDELREDALVTVSNISSHLDLTAFEQDVCRPLLESLLYWATCRATYARDPFAAIVSSLSLAGSALSPQTLAIEAMCKLCVHSGNVDLLLATPPWSRVVRLFGELVRLVGEAREPALRELAIVLVSGLVQADTGVARALALHEPACVALLLSFLEAAEHNAMQMMQSHGIAALRDNPEAMGTSPEMVRRVAAVLFVLAQVPDNRLLFQQQQTRLLSLVMSPILDQGVTWSVSAMLFECSRQ